jgi:hypothetical protein
MYFKIYKENNIIPEKYWLLMLGTEVKIPVSIICLLQFSKE